MDDLGFEPQAPKDDGLGFVPASQAKAVPSPSKTEDDGLGFKPAKQPLPTTEALTPSPTGTLTQRAAKLGAIPSPLTPAPYDTTQTPLNIFSGAPQQAGMPTEEEKSRPGFTAPPAVTLPGPHGVPIKLSDSQIRALGQVFLPGLNPNATLQGGAPIINPERGLFAPQNIYTDVEKEQHPIFTGLGQVAEGLSTPGNMALMASTLGLGEAPALIRASTSAYFYDQMVKGAAEAGQAGIAAYKSGNMSEAKRLFAQSFGSIAMAGLAGYHGVKEGGEALGNRLDAAETARIQDNLNKRSALLDTLPPGRQIAVLGKMMGLDDLQVQDFIDELPSMAKAPGGKLQLGADVGRLSKILGGSMYTNRGAPVVVKELLQNAVDAVRGNGGKIKVGIDSINHTVNVLDTGIGMTPEQVYTVFSDIGSSGKATQEGASGGFGLAKIAPFMIPDKMVVMTVADTPEGRMMTKFTSTPEDIVSGNITPTIKKVSTDQPTGTSIQTFFGKGDPDRYDPHDFYGADEFMKKFLGSTNLPTKNLEYSKYGYPVVSTAAPLNPVSTPITGPGGAYDVHTSPTSTKHSGDYVNYEVQNNGIYQFTQQSFIPGASKVSMPERIVVDVKPTVNEGSEDYPFTTNRESLQKQHVKFLDKYIQNKFVMDQLQQHHQLIKEKYFSMPTMTTDTGFEAPIYDSGARFTPEEIQHIVNHPMMRDINNAIHAVTTDLVAQLSKLPQSVFGGSSEKMMGDTIQRIGMLFSDRAEGGKGNRVYGLYVTEPDSNRGRASIFINPFGWANTALEAGEAATKSPAGLGPKWYLNPDIAANSLMQTITHEITHDPISGHPDPLFASGLAHVQTFIGAKAWTKATEELANAFADPKRPEQLRADFGDLLSLYRESRKRPETEKDILGGEAQLHGGEQPESGEQAPRPNDAPLNREEDLRNYPQSTGGVRYSKGPVETSSQPSPTSGAAPQGRGPLTAAELGQKLRELSSIVPSFHEPTGAGGAGGGERPPVISKETDADLLRRGVHIVEKGRDMGPIGRFLGSFAESARLLDQQGHPLGPLLRSMAGTMSDVVKSISANQTATMRDYVTNAKRLVSREEWSNDVVKLLDDPNVTPSNIPAGTPDRIKQAYLTVRAIDERLRVGIRDAKRNELLLRGIDPKLAAEWIPDDWGITEGHYHHSFPGSWTITKLNDVDEKGNENYVPIETGWRAESKSAAQDKAIEYLRAHPNEQLKLQQDTVTLPGKNISDLKALRDITKGIKEASDIVVRGGDPEDVLKQLYSEAGAKAYGEKQPAKRQLGAALQRESNLPGWARDRENFERYLMATERYIQLAPARQILLKARNEIATLAGLPGIQRIGDMPSPIGYYNARQYGNLLARVDGAIEGLEGHPGMWDNATKYTLSQFGLDPNLLNNSFRPLQAVTALLKLGFNPARVMSHGLQTLWAVYPVLGEKATLQGIAHSFDSNYNWLVKDLAIPHGMNATELEGLRTYVGDYFGHGSNPIDWTKGVTSILKDVGMLPFAMGIDFTRRTAAIGAFIKGIEEGMPRDQARNYARDIMDRTTGSYTPADNATFTRQLPAPVAQFKGFMLKTSQFIWGLRTPGEIARFMGAVGILGYAGLPFLRTFSNLIQNVTGGEKTGVDLENYFKRKFPVASRGVFGLAGVDIPAGVGLGDLSIGHTGAPLAGLAGPAASDAIAVGSALIHNLTNPVSRESSQETDTALRNISPEFRRIYDESVRLATGKPNLTDPRTGSIIIKNLTPTERTEMFLGLTPLRVAQERESHEYIRNQIEKEKDKRGYFVDHLADIEVSLSNPKLSDSDRKELVQGIVSLSKQAQEYGVAANLAKAVRERAREMMMERLTRDVKKSPKAERLDAYQEMKRYREANPAPLVTAPE